VIRDVTNARTWRQYDRICGVGIPEGAYIVDPVMPGATRLRTSSAATVSGNVRLYDADIARFSEPRGTFMRMEPPPGTRGLGAEPPSTKRVPQTGAR
jgi:hypothetical protein